MRHLESLVEAGASANRSEGLRNAVGEYIESAARENEEIKDGIVNLYLEDRIGFSDLERFLGYEEAQSIREKREG